MFKGIEMTDDRWQYLQSVSLRDSDLLQRLRAETAQLGGPDMQITPDEGQFLNLLVKLVGARNIIEVGVFTGYSTLCQALALPEDGHIIACDIDEGWTQIARRYWQAAGVAHMIDLRLAPAVQTLADLVEHGQAGLFDFAFIDADKPAYDSYYERCLTLVRPGGLIALDNTLFGSLASGEDPDVTDEEIHAMHLLNEKLHADERIDLSMLPISQGLTLVHKRSLS